MTERKNRKLAHEILALIGIIALLTLGLFFFLSTTAMAVVETYCFDNDIVMTEFDWLDAERWVLGVSAAVSAVFFSILFLALLRDRMVYIRRITDGIGALTTGQEDHVIPLEGANELTELARAINEMSAARQRLRQREQELAQEKEQLIRTLSHDIRTPLTSVLAYADYLVGSEDLDPRDQKECLELIRRKSLQIRDLTEVLLDGGRRNPEPFMDARLLMEQLAEEFSEGLEDFDLELDLSGCPVFAGTFDVAELRRIFDNMASNILKYADPAQPVRLEIAVVEAGLRIRQSNGVGKLPENPESYHLGIRSIRRIAQNYGGQVLTAAADGKFEITVILSEI